MRITVLCGGLGGARLALALQQENLLSETSFVTNVGDDWTVGDLRVCPDTDAVLYALSGRFDEERGWGIRGDVFPPPGPGEPDWFGLGEADRRHHRRRRELSDQLGGIVAATAELAKESGVIGRVIPVTGSPVETQVVTADGVLAFQEWLVRERGRPDVVEVRWPGTEWARASDEALDAIMSAQVIVISSSSPVASIEPMLRVPGIREALESQGADGRVVVISPIVRGRPVQNNRDAARENARAKLLAAWGIPHEPAPVLARYRPWATRAILDPADAGLVPDVEAQGFRVTLAPIVDQSPDARRSLVRGIVEGAS
jgi:LPPG:FO 2-phospho-L-lactate transferase